MTLERCPRGSATPAGGVMVTGALLFGAALAGLWLRLGFPLPGCDFKAWTGFPCATCGSTRMVKAVLSGNFFEAATSNPLVFTALAAIALASTGSAARAAMGLPAWRLVLARRERLGLALIATAALAGNWAYLLWRGI